MKKHFGQQLKAARLAAGYTQKLLAQKVGIAANTLATIERGEQGMRWGNFERLVDALGIPPAGFFSAEQIKVPKPAPPTAAEALKVLSDLLMDRRLALPEIRSDREFELARDAILLERESGDEEFDGTEESPDEDHEI